MNISISSELLTECIGSEIDESASKFPSQILSLLKNANQGKDKQDIYISLGMSDCGDSGSTQLSHHLKTSLLSLYPTGILSTLLRQTSVELIKIKTEHFNTCKKLQDLEITHRREMQNKLHNFEELMQVNVNLTSVLHLEKEKHKGKCDIIENQRDELMKVKEQESQYKGIINDLKIQLGRTKLELDKKKRTTVELEKDRESRTKEMVEQSRKAREQQEELAAKDIEIENLQAENRRLKYSLNLQKKY